MENSLDNLPNRLKTEKENGIKGGIYHKIQVELTYNSNRIEGSRLSEEQTGYIYETNTAVFENRQAVNTNDIIETANHFNCINMIIDEVRKPLSETFIKKLHFVLKNGTSDSRKP